MEMSSIKDLKAYTLHPIFHPFFLLYWKSVSWIFLLLIVMVVIVVQAPLLPPAPLYHHGSRCEVFYLSTYLIINTVNMTFLLEGGGGNHTDNMKAAVSISLMCGVCVRR